MMQIIDSWHPKENNMKTTMSDKEEEDLYIKTSSVSLEKFTLHTIIGYKLVKGKTSYASHIPKSKYLTMFRTEAYSSLSLMTTLEDNVHQYKITISKLNFAQSHYSND